MTRSAFLARILAALPFLGWVVPEMADAETPAPTGGFRAHNATLTFDGHEIQGLDIPLPGLRSPEAVKRDEDWQRLLTEALPDARGRGLVVEMEATGRRMQEIGRRLARRQVEALPPKENT